MGFRKVKERYDLFQADYYETAFVSKIYHRLRYRTVLAQFKESKSSVVLDLGCDGGGFSYSLANKAEEVVGLDVSSSFIKHAHRKYGDRVSFVLSLGEFICFRDNAFDVVTCLEVLEHAADPRKMVDEVYRILKPSGMCVFLVPNERSLLFRFIWGLWKRSLRGSVWEGAHLSRFDMKDLISMFSNFAIQRIGLCNLGLIIAVKAMKAA